MDIEKERQSEARKKIQDLLKNAEEARSRKRISHGISELISGNLELLHNDELTGAIPGYLADVGDDIAIDETLQLLQRIGEAAVSADAALRTRAVMILSLSIQKVIDAQHIELTRELASVLLSWLSRENDFIAGYEVLCRQLQEISNVFLHLGYWQDAEILLTTLLDIHQGKLKKKNSMRSVAGRTLENIARPEMLGKIYEDLLAAPGAQQRCLEKILICLGRPAVLYGMELLEESEDIGRREQISQFLTRAGRTTISAFAEQMQTDSRWDVRCDMLRIVSAMNDDGAFPLIEQNLLYPDVRVQRESLDCIIRADGERMVQRLTEALPHIDDSLKHIVIKRLAKQEKNDIRDALLSLLDEKVSKKDFSDELLLSAIVVGLRPYADTSTLIQLNELKEYLERGDGSRKLLHLIDDTLLMMESEMRHKRHRKIESENVSYSDDPESVRQAKKKTWQIEQAVIALLEQGLGKQAAEKLFQKCIEAARAKDFATAERLRDRILGAHPGSLDLVIEAEEIITEERESSIPSQYVELWKNLRGAIGTKEFDNLYGLLIREYYEADEIIAREGERNDRLYFIDTGSVSLICTTGSAKTFLKRMEPGSIIGSDQFFTISVWTVAAKARTPVELHSLKRDALRELEKKFPGIEKKLQEYCAGSESVPDLLKMSGGDRRSSVRYPMAAIIRTLLIDAFGDRRHRSFVGQLQDISQGGFCYSIGIANSENARLLLGRQVRFQLEIEDDTLFEIEGVVVGIKPAENTKELYNVHVRLLEFLSSGEVKRIVEMLG